MVEGHTDSQTVKPGAYIKDNWELSVDRATAVIRELQDDYGVDPAKLIAAGRSSYPPINRKRHQGRPRDQQKNAHSYFAKP